MITHDNKNREIDNLVGKRFCFLTVQKMLDKKDKYRYFLYECKCDCGNYRILNRSILLNRKNLSCGCKRKKRTAAPDAIPKYMIHAWIKMKKRCYTTEGKYIYPSYLKKGITVCDEWLNSLRVFYEDMGERPSKSHSIDRIDNNKGYSKENCRWATFKEQANNTSTNVRFNYQGKMLSALEIVELCNNKYTEYQVRYRLKKGITVEEIVSNAITLC